MQSMSDEELEAWKGGSVRQVVFGGRGLIAVYVGIFWTDIEPTVGSECFILALCS